MGRQILYVIISVLAMFICGIANSKVENASYDNLVNKSAYIVVGEVVDKIQTEKIYVAKIKVDKTIKGKEAKELYFNAGSPFGVPRIVCDSSNAEVGEKVLLFLERKKYHKVDAVTYGIDSSILSIASYGQGKFEIKYSQGEEVIELYNGQIQNFPFNKKIEKDEDCFIKLLIPLDIVIDSIRSNLAENSTTKK